MTQNDYNKKDSLEVIFNKLDVSERGQTSVLFIDFW
jgi:hypothetical protein